MSKVPPTVLAMRELLTRMGLQWREEEKFAGHRIDFVVPGEHGLLLLDTNGDRWHSWQKIVDCDRVKLTRVLDAGGLPLGVWWSRQQRCPAQVEAGIRFAMSHRLLPWWDWKVDPRSLLSASSREAALSLGAPAFATGWPWRPPGSGPSVAMHASAG